MESFIEHYGELELEDLLAVNGGYSSGSGGGWKYSSSSNTGGGSVTVSSANYGGSSGGSTTSGTTGTVTTSEASPSYCALTSGLENYVYPGATGNQSGYGVPAGYDPQTGWIDQGANEETAGGLTQGEGENGAEGTEPATVSVNPLGEANITGAFDSTEYDINNDGIGDLHAGVDITSETRQVDAAKDGTVLYAGEHPYGTEFATGTLVIIQYNDGNYGLYGHMDPNDLSVSVGQEVNVGDSLGRYYNGIMGQSSGAHLHYAEFSGETALTGNELANLFNGTGYVRSGNNTTLPETADGYTFSNGLTVVNPDF
ncbi:M23 family metallopeptidase [Brucepastera parasyntrophica]|uniref:M23 family metallopeptidase n=1 Tax=Brucepastera parasyntrophica TaxID=2880008 RepID=UPI002109A3D8|nr:M23 family metallopeptidase [Brucepastera parasyntrophica]ULQ58794.1 M23 family metallopeptidase [Brucepastera parasyntrophica]